MRTQALAGLLHEATYQGSRRLGLGRFGLRAAAIAYYPMYRGLAKLAGMTALPAGPSLSDSLVSLREHWGRFDFFFVHFKGTDSAGEDGDFRRKVQRLEEVDAFIPDLLALEPDVVLVTGDHATPSTYRAHSWHPVPFLLTRAGASPTARAASTNRTASRARWGCFRPPRSCRWPWPTPAVSPSMERDL